MTVPRALQEPGLRLYPLRRLRIPAAGGTLSIVVPRSMMAVLEVDGAGGRVEEPYWAEVWPSAVAIARRLLRGPRLDDLRVVDLGCGVGLAGVAAGRHGAQVTFVDRDDRALRFAAFNARHGGGAAGGFEVVCASWTRAGLARGADLLLLSDVSYDRRHHDPLLERAAECVAGGGRVLHADPYREESNAFVARLRDVGETRIEREDTGFAGARVDVRLTWVVRRPG